MSWLQSWHGRIQCFLLIQLKLKHQGYKADAATCEFTTVAHHKHQPMRLVWSGVVQCSPVLPGVVLCG